MLTVSREPAISEALLPQAMDDGDSPAETLWPSDDDFQSDMLKGVSRTFALTIPQLPKGLHRVVSNAYLLCRVMDTIEDEPAMTGVRKNYCCRQFLRLLDGSRNAESFSQKLSASLSSRTLPAEHDLVRHLPRVLLITRSFSEPQRQAVQRCLRIMGEGMGQFQLRAEKNGVDTVDELDRYCYYVAGVVGQMLTRLFCFHSAEIAKNHDAMMDLSISFGQGLQMTNILKDLWEDYRLGACWLPRRIFAEEGFDLRDLTTGRNREGFERGIRRLIGIAHGHLKNALVYSLLIPKHETGIRKFCLWAIGMALLTLRKIDRRLDYTDGEQVKISRLSVKATVLFTGSAVKHDALLKALFLISAQRLPLTFPVTGWHGIEAGDGSSHRAM